ncbi:MAG: DNA-directed RNA polymerase subunit beta' [Candidatus Nomurabacteria bacterium]|jgi:DNA-directed RNA polymerase subunit beta'|nr:DNA-directed RNA polymerase subunit beta' [Candidatus Nomurabacteria bacterium]
MGRFDQYIGTNDFDSIRLGVASSEDILNWSYGEVLKPETINYRTQKPERDGLFCERIFGPVKDINPHDGKLKGIRSREAAVDRDGNLVTKAISRRERMGHITLAVPVAHIWFMRGVPSAVGLLLDMTVKSLEKVVYFASFVVTAVDEKAKEQKLKDLEAQTTAAREAIKLRYEEAAKDKNADVKVLAEEQAKEIEVLETDYAEKKAWLTRLNKYSLITEMEYAELPEEYEDLVKVGMGGVAIKELLDEIDIDKAIEELMEAAKNARGQREKKIVKRLKVMEGMRSAGIKPSDLMLTVIPVIPPDLRPIVSLAGGRFVTSDINDLYRRVINRNNRLKKLMDLNAPDVICRNEMRMLQEAVDSLIDNSATHGNRTAKSSNNKRQLKSLSDMLKGKQGRFRQNLLGKRVDYSGRSVIVVGPELNINQCGLPKQMAMELFRPFVISWLIRNEHANNIKNANHMIESNEAVVWDALDEVIADKYVLLNRAPTLHKLSIQAFQPKLIDGQAIQLHPLVAKGFNADYDGDQMAVHLPISQDAQKEAKGLISVVNNLLKPADGAPVLSIEQDVVLGIYYLTYDKGEYAKNDVRIFSSVYEAELAYDNHEIQLQYPIKLPFRGAVRETTLGRVLFNEVLPEDYPFDNSVQNKKQLKKVMNQVFAKYGAEVTVKIADAVKALSFKYETIAGVSTSKNDYVDFPEIAEMVAEGTGRTAQIAEQYNEGLITDKERYNLTVANWRNIDNKISDFLKERMEGVDTNISMMVNSGARGTLSNIKLASAMIGIMVDVNGHEMELPIRSSFKKGLSLLESFVATRGARQGLVSTALKTADSGYLTRRLVDVAQDVFTTDEEGEDEGFTIYREETELTMIEFSNRLAGRYAAEAVAGHVETGELITREIADEIEDDESVKSVKIYSILSTKNLDGVPKKSYGVDMSTKRLVEANQPVGVIAAQSVGEPGTQLTLDTFHSSGVAGSGAISKGLPRVEELFEARTPKGQAIVSSIDGMVEVWEDNKRSVIQVTPLSSKAERLQLEGRKLKVKNGKAVRTGDIIAAKAKGQQPLISPIDGVIEQANAGEVVVVGVSAAPIKIEVPEEVEVVVKSGDEIKAGDRLTAGSLNLHDLMKYKGVEATERYIINEILRIYAAQGQEVSDKHLEIIVRQMFSRVMIEDAGDSGFIIGDIVSKTSAVKANEKLVAEGKTPCEYKQLLLGITKVAIYSDSFLSAASFQDTTRVLISAAISGKVDRLVGLKENVIIGRKIPVGTGVESNKMAVVSDFAEDEDFDIVTADPDKMDDAIVDL